MIVTSQAFGNVETPHSAKFEFFFEEKKLMGLHCELPSDLIVVVNNNIFDIMFVEFLPCG